MTRRYDLIAIGTGTGASGAAARCREPDGPPGLVVVLAVDALIKYLLFSGSGE
jgi:hypothetical protein